MRREQTRPAGNAPTPRNPPQNQFEPARFRTFPLLCRLAKTQNQGWSLANEMLVTGRKLGAQEALASGLVSTVIAAETEGAFLAQASFPGLVSLNMAVWGLCEIDIRSTMSHHPNKEYSMTHA